MPSHIQGKNAAGVTKDLLVEEGRLVDNSNVTVLASAIRTTLQAVDLTNSSAKGVMVVLDVTLDAASASITLTISGKDAASGEFIALLVATAVAAVGTTTYIVYPGVAAAAEGVTKVVGFPLPLDWRVSIAVADADAMTYSVGAAYIR